MSKYIEVSLRYDKMQEDGKIKKVTEKYLVDTISLSDAERIVTEKMQSRISGEFSATTAKRTHIAEIIGNANNDPECFFLVKCGFITLNETTGKEKISVTQVLVGADDFNEAYNKFLDAMKGTMADYRIVSIAETPILEYFPYKYGKSEEND